MAKKVYKEMSQGGPKVFAALKKRDNFSWTQSPQVSSYTVVYNILVWFKKKKKIVSIQLFVECIEQLQGEDLFRVHISLLLGTAAFERALGDVRMTIRYLMLFTSLQWLLQVHLAVSKPTQCPPLLRDLLSTAKLSDVLGKSTVSTCSVASL